MMLIIRRSSGVIFGATSRFTPAECERYLFRAKNYHRLQWKVYVTYKTNLISFSIGVQFRDGWTSCWSMRSVSTAVALWPRAPLPQDCSLLPGRLFIDPDGICDPRSSDSSKGRCLPQNFVPAMTASVPLTAVQVADADLLEIQRKTKSWTSTRSYRAQKS